MVYHADCIEANWDTGKVKNIVAQDRGFRRRVKGEREAAKELKLRAQMYRSVISSILDDTLDGYQFPRRDSLSPVRPMMPVNELEVPVPTPGVDGVAGEAAREAKRGTVIEKLL